MWELQGRRLCVQQRCCGQEGGGTTQQPGEWQRLGAHLLLPLTAAARARLLSAPSPELSAGRDTPP
jgi:hypothetical protein